MSRIRVLDLAKELNLDTKTTILKLQEVGVQVKNHFNAISDAEADKVRAFVRTGKPAADKDSGKTAGKVVIRRRAAEVETPAEPAPTPVAAVPTPVAEKPAAAVEVAPKPAPVAEPTTADVAAPVASKTEAPAASVEAPKAASSVAESKEKTKAPAAAASPTTQQVAAQKAQAPQPVAPGSTPPAGMPLIRRAGQGVSPVPPSQATTAQSNVTPPRPGTGAPAGAPPGPRANFEGAVIVRKAPDEVPQGATPPPRAPAYSSTAGSGPVPRYRQHNAGAPSSAGVRTYDRAADSGSGGAPRQAAYHAGGGVGAGQRPGGGRPFERSGTGYQGGAGGAGVGGRFNPTARAPFAIPDAVPTTDKSGRPVRDKTRDQQKRNRHDDTESASAKKGKLKGRFDENDPASLDAYLEELEESAGIDNLPEGEDVPLRTVYTPVPNRKKSFSSGKKKDKKGDLAGPTKASKKIVRIEDHITVSDLASEMSVKASVVIKSLMALGMMAGVNQSIDFETATLVAQEFGFEVQNTAVSIGDILSKKAEQLSDTQKAGIGRPPVVTIMGHVDHGKTSLLDAIRATDVAGGEAGGITQHIGAYQVEHNGRKITFLDTPGHEAFTSMRARGAQVTDVVVIVVAADDGVMPQTIEAVAHARAAKVPIVVAVNKIDKPGIDPDRVTRELAQHNVTPEEWGGDSMFVKVSAKTKQGLPDLLEAILLQADVLDLKAPEEGLAQGIVIEARLDKFRGAVATVIVTQGTMQVQDWIVAGTSMGRVKAMHDSHGNKLTTAGPSAPVEILGLGDVPAAGDQFNCVANDAVAKEAVAYRQEKQRQKDLAAQSKATSIDDLFAKISQEANKAKELALIIKADTHGSVEAIRGSVAKLDTEKVKTRVIHSAVGGITESDISLAHASSALVLGFNVRPDKVAAETAEQEGVSIKTFSIIYELIEAVESAMVGKLPPVRSEKVQGHAEVRNTFSVPKVGVIGGCAVLDGKITRNSHIRVLRDQIVIYTGRVGSLKRFKEDAKEVLEGFECGIGVENYNDIKVGDTLEAFIIEETAATLK